MTLFRYSDMRFISSLILSLGALFFLIGADGCPIVVNPDSSESVATPSTGSSEALDIGGPGGATWTFTYEEEIFVTLRSETELESKRINLGDPPVLLAGHPFHLDTFCWRMDVVCPAQVLTTETTVIQPDSNSPANLLLGFNPRGPLSLVELEGLPGTLDGKDLYVPLAMKTVNHQPCTFGSISGIAGTASVSDGSTEQADTLQGRVTLSYSGMCINVGGTTVIDANAVLELSTLFVAKRQ